VGREMVPSSWQRGGPYFVASDTAKREHRDFDCSDWTKLALGITLDTHHA